MKSRQAAREISKTNAAEAPVVRHLQRQVANAFVLYANYKRYHWQTYGPLFRDLHRLFDELATDVHGTLDELAERLRMIGQDPVATPRPTSSWSGSGSRRSRSPRASTTPSLFTSCRPRCGSSASRSTASSVRHRCRGSGKRSSMHVLSHG